MDRDDDSNDDRRVVAVGLLTRREVTMLGAQLSRLYPVEGGGPFADLIDAIDEADRACQRGQNLRNG